MPRCAKGKRLVLVVAVAAACFTASTALAYNEPANLPEEHQGNVAEACSPCHKPGPPSQMLCDMCHSPHLTALGPTAGKGPHGLYTTATDRCSACHDIHDARGTKLLPAATVTGSCRSCHDGTGGKGVYGAIAARGLAPGAVHRIDTTSTIPGGNAVTGGSSTGSFKGAGGTLACLDCHSPHDSSTVASFTQERNRTSYMAIKLKPTKTNKLLRSRPGDSPVAVSVYGSDWCLACHGGRSSAGPVHSHPAEAASTTASPYRYESLPVLVSDAATRTTVLGSLAGTNRGYLMPYPRTAQQSGHAPICQQCHEDSRNVGSLSADGLTGTAAAFSVTATDGTQPADNPRFQNFPHETLNDSLLVETDDDLCMNCHPPVALP